MTPTRSWQILGHALLLAVSGLATTPSAHAAASTCSLATPSNLSQVYDPTSATAVAVMASASFTCSNNSNNADTLYYEVGVFSAQTLGTQNRALNGSNSLNYELRRDSANGLLWADSVGARFGSGASPITVPGKSSTTVNLNFYLRVPAGQNSPTGTYLDTPSIKLYYDATPNPGLKDSRSFNLSLGIAASCVLSTPPGNVLFNYTSFQVAPAVASTAFGVNCVKGTAYTLSLDASTGTLLGLNYSLNVQPSGAQTGTGLVQSASISGSMAGGQAGTCNSASCSATASRTLTLSY
jgi:spore coat protein U-like protein